MLSHPGNGRLAVPRHLALKVSPTQTSFNALAAGTLEKAQGNVVAADLGSRRSYITTTARGEWSSEIAPKMSDGAVEDNVAGEGYPSAWTIYRVEQVCSMIVATSTVTN
jgi:hypothetical protein